jgi:DNA repair protein RadD
MDPRPYQTEAVKSARKATKKHGNSLLVAATGLGKTAMGGFYLADEFEAGSATKALVLQHTDELLQQNSETINAITGLSSSVVKAESNDWSGDVVYASIQTLGREKRRADMPAFSHVIYDETHLISAPQPQAVLAHARHLNPKFQLLGLTATPGRGDGRGLRGSFDNICANYNIAYGVKHGFLVNPRVFTIETGFNPDNLPRSGSDYDMNAAALQIDTKADNQRVVEEWLQRCPERQTIAFSTTVKHAKAMAEAWSAVGVITEVVSGDMPPAERKEVIAAFKAGRIQVLCNAMVLTAGFDHPPVSCVVINRPMLSLVTFIQAVGRGLRKVDPEKFPGWPAKTDCVVLDFCGAAARHGTLEFEIDLETGGAEGKIKPYKQCPSCYGYVPSAARCCDLCGHVWHVAEDASGRPRIITDFTMTEIDLLNASPYKWVDVYYDGYSLIATAFTAWAGVFFDGTNWHAVGRKKGENVRHIGIGTKIQAMATADDFLRMHGDKKMAKKNKRWLTEEASSAQLDLLAKNGFGRGMLDSVSKYRASCELEFAWAKNHIRRVISA